MAERINRRELIIKTAAGLFIEQGYAATSVRQISDAVGCTEAALYYHFKDGKRALLQAVVESKTPDFLSILENCGHADSLGQFIRTYVQTMCMFCEERERNIQWVVAEFPNLNDDEKSLFHEKHLEFHAELVQRLSAYVNSEHEADGLAWMLVCALFGYRQIFLTLGLNELTDFSVDDFSEKMVNYLTR